MEAEAEKPDYMTDEQLARFLEWQRAHPYGDQDENGIGLSLLRHNFRLTPSERIERMKCSTASAFLHRSRAQDASTFSALPLLIRNGVRVVVTGSTAMAAHGAQAVETDLDLAYDACEENVVALVEALAPLKPGLRGWPAGVPVRWDETLFRYCGYVALSTAYEDIDLIRNPAGIDSFAGLWKRSDVVTVCGVQARIASISDLAAMKRAAGRPSDLHHLGVLEALRLRDTRVTRI